jgi:chromosome segregation ATPase
LAQFDQVDEKIEKLQAEKKSAEDDLQTSVSFSRNYISIALSSSRVKTFNYVRFILQRRLCERLQRDLEELTQVCTRLHQQLQHSKHQLELSQRAHADLEQRFGTISHLLGINGLFFQMLPSHSSLRVMVHDLP